MSHRLADIITCLTCGVCTHLYHLLIVSAGVGSLEVAVLRGLGAGQLLLGINILHHASISFWASPTVTPALQLLLAAIVLQQVLQPREGDQDQVGQENITH